MKKLLLSIFCLFLGTLEAVPLCNASGGIKLLFFYREDCKWCRMMEQVVDDPSIRKILLENTQMIRVDIYGKERPASEGLTGAELTKKYRVAGVPTLIFMSGGQEELLRIPGVVTKEDFKDLLCHQVRGVKHRLCAN